VDEKVRRLWLKLIVKPSDNPSSQSRKESILNCLCIENKYIQNCEAKWGGGEEKGDKEWINKITNLLEEGKNWNGGIPNRAACLEWLALHGKNDKLMAACLKRLWACESEKYRRAENRVFEHLLRYICNNRLYAKLFLTLLWNHECLTSMLFYCKQLFIKSDTWFYLSSISFYFYHKICFSAYQIFSTNDVKTRVESFPKALILLVLLP